MTDSFRELANRWGWLKAIYASILQAFSARSRIRIAYLFVRPLQPLVEVPSLPEGYALKSMQPEELTELTGTKELGLTPEFLAAAEARGDHCVGAFHNDALVSYVWRGYRHTPIQANINLHFSTPFRYGYKALTLKAHRGLRLQQSLALHDDRPDYAAGVRFAVSYIETHNYPSIVSDKRRGNKAIGLIIWGGNRWFSLCYTTPGARKQGVYLARNHDTDKEFEPPKRPADSS